MVHKKREIDEMVIDNESKESLKKELKTGRGTTLEQLCFYFMLTDGSEVELIPNGVDTMVTIDNVEEYLDLTLSCIFNDAVNL